jgi:putative membrane-bound dehydrogenase-like protein
MVKRRLSVAFVFLLGLLALGSGPRTGPATEKRFPPLQLPAGFKATLFACDPFIEYPSVIAVGPRAGSLFVAVDYMTGLGTDIVRRDEIRLIEDTDGDGYADKSTVFAAGFNSIQGLAYHDGTVYVMHAPFLSSLKNKDGKRVERRDLLTGLGLPPEKNPVRLHCANGVAVGHDGWLYLALGDHGCDVKRPEGDRLVLEGGGILRCRPDGRDLHVFATGLRNIYDIALDTDLNVFVRDNENDGGTYMIRVCHSFFGADHGYPYLYEERPSEALPPLADLGLGSSAGGVCYLESAFPEEYRGNLFFCEWGRAVMRYRPKHSGSWFAPLKEITFAAGAANDPYGFRPTDLVVGQDGALYVSDWADGQRPKRGRGRIYRITSKESKRKAARKPALDSDRYYQRLAAQGKLEKADLASVRETMNRTKLGIPGRLHAVWAFAHVAGLKGVDGLLGLVQADREPRVQVQAIRAIADLTDPVLVKHRLDAGRGDAGIAKKLADMAKGRDPRVVREIVSALGRLRWKDSPQWLAKNLGKMDAALEHAAMQTIRRSQNWAAILKLLDGNEPIRSMALRALSGIYNVEVVDDLLERLKNEPAAAKHRTYADALSRVYKKPGPWVYWGYRPPPRPANTVAWERTDVIEKALDKVLADPDRAVRFDTLKRMRREKVPIRLATLQKWLSDDHHSQRVAAILDCLADYPFPKVRQALIQVIGQAEYASANRLKALNQFAAAGDSDLLEVSTRLEDGPVLEESLRLLSKRPKLPPTSLLLRKTESPQSLVRAAAMQALADLRKKEGAAKVGLLLKDADVQVRRAAASAAGLLHVPETAKLLRTLADESDAGLRRACLDSLRLLKDAGAVRQAVRSLRDLESQPAALRYLEMFGDQAQADAVIAAAKANPAADVLPLVCRMLDKWNPSDLDRRLADLQGVTGQLVRWQAIGPLAAKDASSIRERRANSGPAKEMPQTIFAGGLEGRVQIPAEQKGGMVWLATTSLTLREQTTVQFMGTANGGLRIWIDGKPVYRRDNARAYVPDSERFDAALSKGNHRLLVEITGPQETAMFHLRFRAKSSSADHEKLIQAALVRAGNFERGRKLFFNVAKSQCLKCHRLKDQGERIGPDLTGIGNRFGRIHIIESILQPSRWIAPGYETIQIQLKNGKSVSGTRIAETAHTLTLGDQQGQKHILPLSAIEARRTVAVSTMPDGLERQFTLEEFVDLVGFLAGQK